MKIRKFVTAATAAAVLAAGAVIAPAASALDLKVEGDTCTVTESYPGEYDDLDARLVKGGEALVKQLKKQLPHNVSEIDQFLSGTADDETIQDIEDAAKDKGFDELEVIVLLALGRNLMNGEVSLSGDSTLLTTEAARQIAPLKENREDLRANYSGLGTGTSSDPAIAATAKTKRDLIQIIDTYIKLFQSCEEGKSGTFLVEKPGDRDHDDAFNRSAATSSY